MLFTFKFRGLGGRGEAWGRVGGHLHWECTSRECVHLRLKLRCSGQLVRPWCGGSPRARPQLCRPAAPPGTRGASTPPAWSPSATSTREPGELLAQRCRRVLHSCMLRCHNPCRAHLLPDGLRTTCHVMQVSTMLPCLLHHLRRFWKHVTSLESRETKRYLGALRGAAAPAVHWAALLAVCTGCVGTDGQHASCGAAPAT